MKAKKYWILFVMIVAIFPIGFWAVADTEDYTDLQKEKDEILEWSSKNNQMILRGLVGVTPRVAIISIDVPCNLTKYELQTQVELRLRQSGIKVFSEVTEKDPNSLSSLLVVINLKSFNPGYDVESYTKLNEPVFLFRDPQKFTSATTWESLPSHSDLLRKVPTKTEILEVVNRSVDQFINDYLAANPNQLPNLKNAQTSAER